MWLHTIRLVSSRSLETTRSQIDLKRHHLQEAKKISYCRFAQFCNLSLIMWHNFEQKKKRNWLGENKTHQAMVLLISSSFCDLFLISAESGGPQFCLFMRPGHFSVLLLFTLIFPCFFKSNPRENERGKREEEFITLTRRCCSFTVPCWRLRKWSNRARRPQLLQRNM